MKVNENDWFSSATIAPTGRGSNPETRDGSDDAQNSAGMAGTHNGSSVEPTMAGVGQSPNFSHHPTIGDISSPTNT